MKPALASSLSIQSFSSGEYIVGRTKAVPSSSCFGNVYCICNFSTDCFLLRDADRHLSRKIASTKKLIAMTAVIPAMMPALASCESPLLLVAASIGVGVAMGASGGFPVNDAADMATRLGGVVLLVFAWDIEKLECS